MKMNTLKKLSLACATVLVAGSLNAQTTASSASYTQGPRADGVSPIGVTRSNPDNALGGLGSHDVNIGEQANNSASVEFVSLGFGGSIVLTFDNPICNIEGNDLTVYETSYGTPSCNAWPERALVYASQTNCGEESWVMISPEDGICQDADLDLGVLSWAKYIRIMDITNPTLNVFASVNQDGFDVDAVIGYESCDGGAFDAGAEYSPNQVVNLSQGNRKNGSAIPANRSIQSRMLGAPQMSDASTPASNYPFFALGYGGVVELKFPFTILNKAGADVIVYETTFGDNPTRTCASYPEKASFEGSADGVNWFALMAVPTADDAGSILCRDGSLMIPDGEAGINYIRVTDVTVPFGAGSTDAYDIDGIVGVGQCSSASNGSGREGVAPSTGETIGEGEYGIEVFPNPTSGNASVSIEALNNKDNYTINVIDVMGRVISSDVINQGKASFIHNLDVQDLPAGIYMISVESHDTREVTKLIKK